MKKLLRLGILAVASFTVGSLFMADQAKANDDQRPGVVAQCGTMLHKTFKNVSSSNLGMSAKQSDKYSNVVVIEDDGSLLEANDINLCTVAKTYYKNFEDDRHMLFVFAQGSSDAFATGYNAYYSSVRNDVKNIGRSLSDRSKECGSNSVLLGYSNMNSTGKWKPFLFPLLDLWPLGVITHEIGHQWIAYIDNPVKGIKLTTDRNSSLRSHWQPLVHTHASIMYGNHWNQLTPGGTLFGKKVPATFASTLFPAGFSELDKYLMGVLPPSGVKPFFGIQATNGSKIIKHYATPANTAAGNKVDITIQDVQAAVGGARIPDWRSSQKKFNAAFIMVVPKGKKAKDADLKVVDYFRKRIPEHFKSSTNNVLEIATSVRAKPTQIVLRPLPVSLGR